MIDHLEELRRRIIYSIAAVGICSAVGFVFSKQVLNLIIKWSNLHTAYFFTPLEAFSAQVKVAIFLGIFVSFPFVLYQTWRFMAPGLTQKEQKVSFSYLFFGMILFLIGIFFGYFGLINFGLKFLLSFASETLQPLMNISKYLSFILWCLLGCGILFQLPLVIFTLIRLGILDINTLTKHRAEAIIAILVLGAIITPSTDLFTMLFISIPLILLFELSILAARLSKRHHKASQP